jgi:hypothetical protein
MGAHENLKINEKIKELRRKKNQNYEQSNFLATRLCTNFFELSYSFFGLTNA